MDAFIVRFDATVADSEDGTFDFWELMPEGALNALWFDYRNDLLGNMRQAGDGATGLINGASSFEHVFSGLSTADTEALKSASYLDIFYSAWGDLIGSSVTIRLFSETNGQRVLVGEGTFDVLDGQGDSTWWRVSMSWVEPDTRFWTNFNLTHEIP